MILQVLLTVKAVFIACGIGIETRNDAISSA
jgi:hypothetical protein